MGGVGRSAVGSDLRRRRPALGTGLPRRGYPLTGVM